jgi:hypothetical protein
MCVLDYTERFYNATRHHSTIGYVSPVEFERKMGLIDRASIRPVAAHPNYWPLSNDNENRASTNAYQAVRVPNNY